MAKTIKFKLGEVARDKITGYEGVIIAKTFWLNGCKRICLQARSLKDGKPIESQSFDVEQCEARGPGITAPEKASGGPMPEPVPR